MCLAFLPIGHKKRAKRRVVGLLAVDIDSQNGTFSLTSELMINGNIVEYIRVNKVDRIRLVSLNLSTIDLSVN